MPCEARVAPHEAQGPAPQDSTREGREACSACSLYYVVAHYIISYDSKTGPAYRLPELSKGILRST